MEETIALINQIFQEHEVILHRTQEMEQVANDIEAIIGMV